MIDWLILAEKASQGRDIAKALCDLKRPQGDLVKGGLGGHNVSSRFPGELRVARFQGHVAQMAWPEEQDPKYKEGKSIPQTKEEELLVQMGFSLPSATSPKGRLSTYPIELPIGSDRILFKPTHAGIGRSVLQLFQKARHIIIATDADAEGEMIFRNWAKVYLKDRFSLPYDRLYRVLISSTDPVSIHKAFDTTLQRYDQFSGEIGQFYGQLFPQGYARGICDYEFGLSYTLYGQLLTGQTGMWGRLKNTILGHVYQAELAHDSFKKGNQYRVDLRSENGVLLKGSTLYKTREDAEKAIQNLPLEGEIILQGQFEEQRTLPPSLFSRTELLASSKGKGQTLQMLYEQYKVLSYPRSDSRHITLEEWEGLKQYCQLPQVKELLLAKDPNFPFFFDREPIKKYVDPSKTIPHYALIPNTQVALTPSLYQQLDKENRRVFLVDLYRSLSLFANDCVTRQLKVGVDYYGLSFKDTFNEVLDQGWRKLTGELLKDDRLPLLGSQKVQVIISRVPLKQPALLSVPKLLTLLKARGEGTSATRDQTIEDLLKRKALVKGLRLNPSLKLAVGEMLELGWINLDQTVAWQQALDQISTMEEAYAFIDRVRKETRMLQKEVEKKVLS